MMVYEILRTGMGALQVLIASPNQHLRQDMSDDSEELPRPRSKPPGCPRFLDDMMGIGGQGGVGDGVGFL